METSFLNTLESGSQLEQHQNDKKSTGDPEKRQGSGTSPQPSKINPEIDLCTFFSEIITRAESALAGRGVRINAISLGVRESQKCITAFENGSIYYRIGRTIPRKGKYRGAELLVMELIMDGNKKNVFIPMLKRQESLEDKIGARIDRAGNKSEATGKYRFKVVFPLKIDKGANYYSKFLGDFIYHTKQELEALNIK